MTTQFTFSGKMNGSTVQIERVDNQFYLWQLLVNNLLVGGFLTFESAMRRAMREIKGE